jgi:hypothetical protein
MMLLSTTNNIRIELNYNAMINKNGVVLLDVSHTNNLKFLGRLATYDTLGVFINEEVLAANDDNNLKFYRRAPELTTGIKENRLLKPFAMYPNQAKNQLNFYFNNNFTPKIAI